jgi:lipopolysaccharide heptosyltransferase I
MIAAPDRLLVIKPSSFGDIIHALPILPLLRDQWPQTAIDWLVKEEWGELLLSQPELNEVLFFPKTLSAWRALKKHFRRTRYDLVIDLQGLLRSGIASLMTGAPLRIGFAGSREGSRWCYTTRFEPGSGSMHAVERNLDLLRQFGLPAVTTPTFPLPTSRAADDWLESLWRKEHLDHPESAVVIHPAARWKTKRWPAKRFAEVGDRLSAAHSARIFLIAGSEQSAQASEVVRHMQCRVVNLAGRTSLPQLMALLRRASLLISNDSGPMHLAAALGSPVIGIFGPTDPRRVGPYGAVNVALKKNFLCSGCSRQRCTHAQECLRAISVDEVVESASTMLRRRMTRKESAAVPSGAGIRP